MLRNDGSVTIYVLRHVHPYTIKKGWDGKKWDSSGTVPNSKERMVIKKRFSRFTIPFALVVIHGKRMVSMARKRKAKPLQLCLICAGFIPNTIGRCSSWNWPKRRHSR